MMELMVPSIHINGTSYNQLFECFYEAIKAIAAADMKLRECAPNGRDYYPQGSDAIILAQKQHQDRLNRLASISDEISSITETMRRQVSIHANRVGIAVSPLTKESTMTTTEKRIIAEFVPQAWVGDYAVEVDPEGETTADLTDEIVKMGEEGRYLQDDTYETDYLRFCDAAPKWWTDWRGPFYIRIQGSIEDFYEE